MNIKNLIFDRRHIWHPYTSITNPYSVYPIVSTSGYKIILNNGMCLIDGMSSWWSVIHGYNNFKINKVINKQIKNICHVMFSGISHLPAIKLCDNLINLTPNGLDCVFLNDSGSISIEIAIKMTLQYWSVLNNSRCKFIALNQGYHGDTFGAMSVCDPNNIRYNFYKNYLPSNLFIKIPKYFNDKWNYNKNITFLAKLLDIYHNKLAGLILEPIVQCAGGINFYHPEYLYQIRLLCDYYDIIFIIDEIATGFGRTGELFACDYSGVTPDIICLGKALTGGMVSLSATLTTRKVAEIISNNKIRCFMHGPTFMANPLACSIANISLSLLKNENWRSQVFNIFIQLKLGLCPLISHSRVKDIRVLGAIGVIETIQLISLLEIQKWFIKEGVWVRPFKKFIYLMPPYVITNSALKKLINTVIKSLDVEKHFIN